TTFAYLEGRAHAPRGAQWEQALASWRGLRSDPGALYDKIVAIDAAKLIPHVTWGTNPGMVAPVTGLVPDPQDARSEDDRKSVERALRYMGLQPLMPIQDIQLDRVFIGSGTQAGLRALRAGPQILRGTGGQPPGR